MSTRVAHQSQANHCEVLLKRRQHMRDTAVLLTTRNNGKKGKRVGAVDQWQKGAVSDDLSQLKVS